MNPKQRRNSQNFLDKFEGKKQIVSREGLLHLLQAKRQSFSPDSPKHTSNKLSPLQSKEIIPKKYNRKDTDFIATPNSQRQLPKKAMSIKQGQLKYGSHLNSQVIERYSQPREQMSQPKSVQYIKNRVKLPAINKSTSRSSNIGKAQNYTPNAELMEIANSLKLKSMPRRKVTNQESQVVNNLTKKMELDKYALRHLQFLDKFQLQLLGNDNTVHKRTVRSEYL